MRGENSASIRREILRFLSTHKEFTSADILKEIKKGSKKQRQVYKVIRQLRAEGVIEKLPLSRKYVRVKDVKVVDVPTKYLGLIPSDIPYYDWNENIRGLLDAYRAKEFALLVGPPSVGKTQAVRKLAELVGAPLWTVNFSLRTREHHLIGRPTTDEKGNIFFQEGPLPTSMRAGGIFYADEFNAAEPDMLLRLDEALDRRRQIRLETETVVAQPNWYVIASVNPLEYGAGGIKPLPPQILSRFTVVFHFKFPDQENEYRIMKLLIPQVTSISGEVKRAIQVIHKVRSAADLPYIPGVRETRSVCYMLTRGLDLNSAMQLAVVNRYAVFSEATRRKVSELIYSMLGSENQT